MRGVGILGMYGYYNGAFDDGIVSLQGAVESGLSFDEYVKQAGLDPDAPGVAPVVDVVDESIVDDTITDAIIEADDSVIEDVVGETSVPYYEVDYDKYITPYFIANEDGELVQWYRVEIDNKTLNFHSEKTAIGLVDRFLN